MAKLQIPKTTKDFLHSPHLILKIVYLIIGLGFLVIGAILLWIAFTPLPDVNAFIEQKSAASTKIYDRTGQVVLYDLNTDVKRDNIPLASTSPYIREATI